MKVRNCFVSNSSSSMFLIMDSQGLVEDIRFAKHIANGRMLVLSKLELLSTVLGFDSSWQDKIPQGVNSMYEQEFDGWFRGDNCGLDSPTKVIKTILEPVIQGDYEKGLRVCDVYDSLIKHSPLGCKNATEKDTTVFDLIRNTEDPSDLNTLKPIDVGKFVETDTYKQAFQTMVETYKTLVEEDDTMDPSHLSTELMLQHTILILMAINMVIHYMNGDEFSQYVGCIVYTSDLGFWTTDDEYYKNYKEINDVAREHKTVCMDY